jgi:dienelactone hydrolase
MIRSCRAGAAVLAALFVPTIGCLAAPPTGAPSVALARSPATAKKTSLAGVVYDPAAPLDATVTRLGGQGVTSYAVRYKGANGDLVPGVLTLPAPPATGQNAAPPPCVLLLHGIGGSKADLFLLALSFAGRGYATLAIDIAGHGERPRVNNKPPSELGLTELRIVGATTVVDLKRAVDFLATRSEVDKNHVGFVGVSLGGILGGVFISDEPRVKAATLWAAGGDWGLLATTSQHPFARHYREKGADDARTIEARLAELDPAKTIARFGGRPLLLLNGAADTAVPPACTDALFQAAREPKQRVTLPGGHVPDITQLMERTLAFLDVRLKPVPVSAASARR